MRPVRRALAWAGLGILGGCSVVTSYDGLLPGSGGGDAGMPDTTMTGEAAAPPDAGPVSEAGMIVDGPPVSECTPDPAFCNGHCGSSPDNCGVVRNCSSTCGANQACDMTTHTCACVELPGWCNGRCGNTVDNCNMQVPCPSCEGGLTCSMANSCGCVPESPSVACGSRQCGSVTNNCGQGVPCGVGGTSNCASPSAICDADSGTCCVPDNAAACNGKCNTTAVNNCGQTVSCPTMCPSGQVCNGASCCTPDPLTTTCASINCGNTVNNCGQTVACPDNCFCFCPNGGSCITGTNNCHCIICRPCP